MTIHVFGDSHADNYNHIEILGVELKVWQKSTTIYNFVHQIADEIDFSVIKDDDIVLFVFGEIDIRFRIHQQIEKGRTVDEVVDSLISEYIQKIMSITQNAVIVLPIPQTYRNIDPIDNPEFPVLGSVENRVRYWNAIKNAITKYPISIFDPFSSISYPGPYMDIKLFDHIMVHLDERYNILLQTALVNFLRDLGKITIQSYSNCINYIYT